MYTFFKLKLIGIGRTMIKCAHLVLINKNIYIISTEEQIFFTFQLYLNYIFWYNRLLIYLIGFFIHIIFYTCYIGLFIRFTINNCWIRLAASCK